MVLMVTAPPSCIRPPPDPPPLPCKPPPLEACSIIISPEPSEPTAALIRLLAPLHILEPSVSSPVPVVAVTPLSFFATTKGTSLRSEDIFSVSSCNKPYMDEYYLVLGISCVKMNHLPLNEDVALSLNLLLPLVEDVTSSLPLPQYEDLTLPQYEDRLMLLKNGGFGWYIHGMYVAHCSQCSILYVVSTFAVETLALPEALLARSCAGLSKLQVFSDSNVFFSALHSGMDLNGIAGCLLDITNLATPFTLLSFKFYQCTAVCLAVAFAMYVFFRLCFTFTLF
ncbi:hypothetical protein HID58_069793 [Brassica napus]|uniref:RNase H type-1 domain-containing protein n=1 Tax=Brassica napus TaxID=3708 RepID=A0ABQ7YX01_BRANA|nr:hypothetical protein HID58_069793 [Brassica napus]